MKYQALVALLLPLSSRAWTSIVPSKQHHTTQLQLSSFSTNDPSKNPDGQRRELLAQFGALAATALVGGGGALTFLQQQNSNTVKTSSPPTRVNRAPQWVSVNEFAARLEQGNEASLLFLQSMDHIQFSANDTSDVHVLFLDGSHWRLQDVVSTERLVQLCNQYSIPNNFDVAQEEKQQFVRQTQADQDAMDGTAAWTVIY